MSSGRRASSIPHNQPGKQDGGDTERPPVEFLPPLKPRPLLAAGLFIILVLWLAALVMMRFTSVKPYANPATAPATR